MVAKLEELEHSVVIAVDLYVVDLETVDLSPNHIKVKKVPISPCKWCWTCNDINKLSKVATIANPD